MSESSSILNYVSIKSNKIIADGRVIFDMHDAPPRAFFESAYQSLGINYPKFFKMDHLSKTSFLACDVLLHSTQTLKPFMPSDVGIVFQTANGSLDTDLLYYKSKETIPSPSLFVYTLPNIAIGELSIRHNIKGESACFIFDIFNPKFQVDYVESLLDTGRSKIVVAGWADFYDDRFEAFFYVASGLTGSAAHQHTAENINKIYTDV